MTVNTQEFRHDEQKFFTGPITISEEAWEAFEGCCGFSYYGLLFAHVRNIKLGSMTDSLHKMNTKALDGDGNFITTIGRTGTGTIFIITTTGIHDNPETYIDIIVERTNNGR